MRLALVAIFAVSLTVTGYGQTPSPSPDPVIGTTISGPGFTGLPANTRPVLVKIEPAVQQDRVAEIQGALRNAKLDGWLFYDFRGSDILIPRILNPGRMAGSRRWYYYVPASGEPVKVVHAIEPGQLDSIP